MIQTEKSTQARHAWSDYWDRHGADGQHLVGGARHSGLFEQFWRGTLSREIDERSHVRLLDAACGDGAVARLCTQMAGEANDCTIDVHATDFSPGALVALGQMEGAADISLVAADACGLPYAGGAFDLVTSQCGLEYAGPEAFDSAARLVAPGGRFSAIIHRMDGLIFRECEANLAILDRLDASGILAQCGQLFELQRNHLAGDVAALDVGRAAGTLGLALTRLSEAIGLSAHGAARSHALRLLADLATLQARYAAYAADQAGHWLMVQRDKLVAFRLRMESMMEAAADATEMSDIGSRLGAAGLEVVTIGEIRSPGDSLPLAWSLDAATA
jgi:SAM-dependent methyltransferase